jgi:hypothetical protein
VVDAGVSAPSTVRPRVDNSSPSWAPGGVDMDIDGSPSSGQEGMKERDGDPPTTTFSNGHAAIVVEDGGPVAEVIWRG